MILRTSKKAGDVGPHAADIPPTQPRSPRCPPVRDEAALLAHLLGLRAIVVGEVDGIALAVRADDIPTDDAETAPDRMLAAARTGTAGRIDAQALWILRHGLVHVLGRDAAALRATREARRRARQRVTARLADLRVALEDVLALAGHPAAGTLAADSRHDDLLDRAEQLLDLIDRVAVAGDRPVASPDAAGDGIDWRRRQIWNALVPDGPHDLPRLVFAAACRAAGLRWPYEAAMVAALEAKNPRAMRFGSGSRLLDHGWRAHALDYWRKAYGALERL